MINTQEPLLSLNEAARAFPAIDGHRPAPSTVFRWMMQGVRGGVKLEFVRRGRRVGTTQAAINDFMRRLAETPAPTGSPAPRTGPRARTAAQRNRDVSAAKARLRAAGVLPAEGE